MKADSQVGEQVYREPWFNLPFRRQEAISQQLAIMKNFQGGKVLLVRNESFSL